MIKSSRRFVINIIFVLSIMILLLIASEYFSRESFIYFKKIRIVLSIFLCIMIIYLYIRNRFPYDK